MATEVVLEEEGPAVTTPPVTYGDALGAVMRLRRELFEEKYLEGLDAQGWKGVVDRCEAVRLQANPAVCSTNEQSGMQNLQLELVQLILAVRRRNAAEVRARLNHLPF